MFLRNLCAIQWTNYLVDVVLAAVLIGYVTYCAKRGFIDCFFGFFSTIVSFLAAIFLAKVLANATGGLFGLQKSLDKNFTDAFMRVDGFDTHYVGEGTKEALKANGVSAVLAQLVLKLTKSAEKGTVLAVALGDVTSSLATTIFCGIIIFILAKLLLRLLRGTLEKIAGKLKIVGAVNTLLGGFVGVLGFTLLISAVLAVFAVLPVRALNNAFNDSILVGVLYKYNPVMWLIGLIL
ncbi:MAG: CvpA family protein [Clostridia bacterium]|nr:CvpA family protein [Clostridia bacterium]